jgi:hypothetical protein
MNFGKIPIFLASKKVMPRILSAYDFEAYKIKAKIVWLYSSQRENMLYCNPE